MHMPIPFFPFHHSSLFFYSPEEYPRGRPNPEGAHPPPRAHLWCSVYRPFPMSHPPKETAVPSSTGSKHPRTTTFRVEQAWWGWYNIIIIVIVYIRTATIIVMTWTSNYISKVTNCGKASPISHCQHIISLNLWK